MSGSGMVVNVAICCVILISAVFGWRKGFAASAFSCIRWFLCMGVSIFAAGPCRNLLVERTGIDESISSHITSVFDSADSSSFFAVIPQQFATNFATLTEETLPKYARIISETLLLIVSFFVILLVLLLLTKLVEKALESKDKDDPIGFINGLFGFVFGALRGVFVISLLIMLLFPLLSFVDPDGSSPLVDNLRNSYIASLLYDNNPISMVLELLG